MPWPSDFARRHPWYPRIAEQVCTRRQLQVLQARAAHASFDEIGAWLGISRQSAHETYKRAQQKILEAHQKEQAA